MNSFSSIILTMVLLMLLIMAAFFSAAETAFTGLSTVRIKNMANTKKRAKLVLKLYKDYDRILATILIGSNIVNITAASISTIIFTTLLGDIGITVSTIVLTLTIIIFCEISPKSLTKEAPEAVAMFCAAPLVIFKYIFLPLNYFFNIWKKVLSKIFKVKNNKPSFTEEEFTLLVDDITDEGVLEQSENYVIQNTIIGTDKTVSEIMTPLNKTVYVKEKQTSEEVYNTFLKERYSRMPVISEKGFIGAIYMKDFYQLLLSHKTNWKQIIKRIIFVKSTTRIFVLLKQLQKENIHLALVLDENKPIGMVTMEDILEEIVGEINDEHDRVVVEKGIASKT